MGDCEVCGAPATGRYVREGRRYPAPITGGLCGCCVVALRQAASVRSLERVDGVEPSPT